MPKASTSARTLNEEPKQQQKRSKYQHQQGKGAKRRPERRAPDAGDAAPGVSKIKAALRQTRRLLARDNVALDIRQEAERRLISLESDLAEKESSQKERKNAERYHKVRFFERQKLVRQIKKVKKRIEEDGESSKKQAKLKGDLHEKRILLNYVLNFPPSIKYVSLFPSSGTSPFDAVPSSSGDAATVAARKNHERAKSVRKRVAEAMEKGELSQEPEVELEQRMAEKSGESAGKAAKRARLDMGSDGEGSDDESEGDEGGEEPRKRQSGSKAPAREFGTAHKGASSAGSKTQESRSRGKAAKGGRDVDGAKDAPKTSAAPGGISNDDFFASDSE